MPFCPLLYMFLSLSLFPPSLRFQPQDEDGYTAFFWAAYYGHAEVVKLLLTEGNAEVDKTDDNGGCTPLYAAADKGNTDVVKLLLRGGADANIAYQGWTPLMAAKHEGHQAIVALLQ